MKTKLYLLTAALGLTSALAFGQTLLFSEDFGSITNETILTNNNTGYDSIRNNNNNALALNPSTIGSGSSMTYGGAAGASNENFYVRYDDPVTGEYMLTTTKFSIKFDDLSSGSWVYFEGGDTGNNFGNGTFQGSALMWGIQIDGSQLRYRSSSESWLLGGLPTLSENVQYDFHIVSNLSGETVTYGADTVANQSMDIFLNGILVGDDLSIQGNSGSVGMKVYQISNENMTFEFDNHEVYSGALAIPEPGTLALVGMFGLAIYAFRKRK